MASIPNNYEINVSYEGVHYCRIELGTMMESIALETYEELKEIFGSKFDLTLEYWHCEGKIIAGET